MLSKTYKCLASSLIACLLSINVGLARGGFFSSNGSSVSLDSFLAVIVILIIAIVIFVANIYLKDTFLGKIIGFLVIFSLFSAILSGGIFLIWFGFQLIGESLIGGILILLFGAVVSFSGMKLIKDTLQDHL